MKKYFKTALTVIISVTVLTMASSTIASASLLAYQTASSPYDRIYGTTKFETANAIADKVGTGVINDVIITSGNNFPDALSVSVLSKKLNAPILLVNSTVGKSSDAFKFITEKTPKNAMIHIIGGTGAISSDFEKKLTSLGYDNRERIGGYDQYNTDALIANKLSVAKGTPVVVASGVSFPDALSISSIAAAKGYPILLTQKDSLSQDVNDFIVKDQPSEIYIIGGTAVISDSVKSTIEKLTSGSAQRLAGVDLFETNSKVLAEFAMSPKTVYVASGLDFSDALAGSSLAASNGDPIALINSRSYELPTKVESYFKSLNSAGTKPSITALGGTAVVSDYTMNYIRAVIDGTSLPVAPQAELVNRALSLLGVRYHWAGTTPSGFDCSGYVQYVFKGSGISLPRTAAEQFKVGSSVSPEELQPGDLVFFTTYTAGASHVGIYIGSRRFVAASNSGVSISNLDDSYYKSRYLGARRLH